LGVPMRIITFKVDEELLREINEACIRMGLCRSELIRLAVKYYIRREARSEPMIRIVG